MAASKKTYVAIAAELKFTLRTLDQHQYDVFAITVKALADALKRDNSAFDKARFLDACGVRP
jgi:hypothetical protein